MKLTLKALRDFFTGGRLPQKVADDVLLMTRIRMCLTRWTARYARSPHAKKYIAETNELIDQIDQWMLRR